jgi:hypothetical protein
MSKNSLIGINLLSPVLFYQNPIDIYQTKEGSTQVYGGGPCAVNCNRNCNQNLASNDPASQYQRQKLIQNTVRVYSSLYTMNLAGLSGYQKPLNKPQLVEQAGTSYIAPARVYWNQMSDRARPSNQTTKVASGSTYHTSSTRHTITRDRPGAMSPGGVGVDIKHNSYNRYLNKLKGKAPLRRGIVPPNYGTPIPFNRAYPVYGGKVVKTAIVNGCDCPDINNADKLIYGSKLSATQDEILSVKYVFNLKDFVWAKKFLDDGKLYKAQIISIDNGLYTIQFEDKIIKVLAYCELIPYYNCDCPIELSIKEEIISGDGANSRVVTNKLKEEVNLFCNLFNIIAAEGIL